MGFLHLLQAGLIYYLSTDFSLPITVSHLTGQPGEAGLLTETLIEIPIGPAVALFLLISSIAHFYVSTIGYSSYIRYLDKKVNPYRWVEYTFSASLMIVIIAMFTGIYDLGYLLAIGFLNASMIWFGWLMEKFNDFEKEIDWSPYIFGCVAGAIPWIAIALYLIKGFISATGQVPEFVLWIYISIAIFFNIFAINQYLQYKQIGAWKNYIFGEKMYIVLSLVAKSALAWQIFSGTLMG
ncbi:MAG: putative membrane protein [Candidatus Methanohalarchaeum thermophilum]|uniref:Membrane protein n=1 Tax=Methanohalarchaeum thermophilum TaxID=1903181 RepID=A0A1Q6DUI7_METT1|nr:MAG: putative membrane protein [Candidatus Methanohalarchaeum thermophilum]